ncbi:hypothetical protein D5S18_15905 [Nocardia panacis]|uniref:Uncharacterized protein n=1 Tax=Nocardia panacis TaxID=2340916 RepID=A0A3A4JWJ0_9NOCA|nr:hypothetical protein D5S18_15905 [Nocardia panacis]
MLPWRHLPMTATNADPFESLYDPPALTFSSPITGNGMAAIRAWVAEIEKHFGGQGLATCHYASLIGYWANLKTFRVEITDRKLVEATESHHGRWTGHAQRLVDAGFLVKLPRKSRERGTAYVLATPRQVPLN